MTPTVDEAAFDAVYDTLIPHVRHADRRIALAQTVVSMLATHHPAGVVETLYAIQPPGGRLTRTVLAEAVTAAHNATERSTP